MYPFLMVVGNFLSYKLQKPLFSSMRVRVCVCVCVCVCV